MLRSPVLASNRRKYKENLCRSRVVEVKRVGKVRFVCREFEVSERSRCVTHHHFVLLCDFYYRLIWEQASMPHRPRLQSGGKRSRAYGYQAKRARLFVWRCCAWCRMLCRDGFARGANYRDATAVCVFMYILSLCGRSYVSLFCTHKACCVRA